MSLVCNFLQQAIDSASSEQGLLPGSPDTLISLPVSSEPEKHENKHAVNFAVKNIYTTCELAVIRAEVHYVSSTSNATQAKRRLVPRHLPAGFMDPGWSATWKHKGKDWWTTMRRKSQPPTIHVVLDTSCGCMDLTIKLPEQDTTRWYEISGDGASAQLFLEVSLALSEKTIATIKAIDPGQDKEIPPQREIVAFAPQPNQCKEANNSCEMEWKDFQQFEAASSHLDQVTRKQRKLEFLGVDTIVFRANASCLPTIHGTCHPYGLPKRWVAALPNTNGFSSSADISQFPAQSMLNLAIYSPTELKAGSRVFGTVALPPYLHLKGLIKEHGDAKLMLKLTTALDVHISRNSAKRPDKQKQIDAHGKVCVTRGCILDSMQRLVEEIDADKEQMGDRYRVVPFEACLPEELPPSVLSTSENMDILNLLEVALVRKDGKQLGPSSQCECLIAPRSPIHNDGILPSYEQNKQLWNHLPLQSAATWLGHGKSKNDIAFLVRGVERTADRQEIRIQVTVANNSDREIGAFQVGLRQQIKYGLKQTEEKLIATCGVRCDQRARSLRQYRVLFTVPKSAPPSVSAQGAIIGQGIQISYLANVFEHQTRSCKNSQARPRISLVDGDKCAGALICIGDPHVKELDAPSWATLPRIVEISIHSLSGPGLSDLPRGFAIEVELRAAKNSYAPPHPNLRRGTSYAIARSFDQLHLRAIVAHFRANDNASESKIDINTTMPLWWRNEDGKAHQLILKLINEDGNRQSPIATATISFDDRAGLGLCRVPLVMEHFSERIDVALSIKWGTRHDAGNTRFRQIQLDPLKWSKVMWMTKR